MQLRLISPDIESGHLSEAHTVIDGKINLKVGDVTWRNYVHKEKDHVLEIELEFASRPASNKTIFAVDHPEGLEGHYQGELPAISELK